jgi:hypothetical protein
MEHSDGGHLGVSGDWIRGEAPINLAAQEALNPSSRVIGWRTNSSIGSWRRARNEPGDQRRRDGIHDAQRQSLPAAANMIEGITPGLAVHVLISQRIWTVDQRSAQLLFEPLYRAGERGWDTPLRMAASVKSRMSAIFWKYRTWLNSMLLNPS